MSASELRAHLLVIAEHARDALALLDDEPAPITLPAGSTACTHPERLRIRTMGGYWTCDETRGGCGFQGRDE